MTVVMASLLDCCVFSDSLFNPFTCTNNFTFVYSTNDDTFIEKLLLKKFLTCFYTFIL